MTNKYNKTQKKQSKKTQLKRNKSRKIRAGMIRSSIKKTAESASKIGRTVKNTGAEILEEVGKDRLKQGVKSILTSKKFDKDFEYVLKPSVKTPYNKTYSMSSVKTPSHELENLFDDYEEERFTTPTPSKPENISPSTKPEEEKGSVVAHYANLSDVRKTLFE